MAFFLAGGTRMSDFDWKEAFCEERELASDLAHKASDFLEKLAAAGLLFEEDKAARELLESVGSYWSLCPREPECVLNDPLDDGDRDSGPIDCSAEVWAELYHRNPELIDMDQTP
jgi:hypothetical protein